MIDENLLPHWKRLLLRKQRKQTNTDENVVFVGNGPSLKFRMMGETIDKFDVVCRFNMFNIKDYSKHTGTKTTHWFLNNLCRKDDNGLKELIAYNNIKLINKIFIKNFDRRNRGSFIRNMKCICTNIQEIGKKPQHQNLPKNKHPSFGLWGVFKFIELGYFPIYVIGFDLIDGKGGHYHDNKWNSSCHDIKSEELVWKELLDSGKVIRL